MNQKQPPLPVCIYALFHPKAKESAALARSIFRWFRLKEDAEQGTTAGLPVYYRTQCKDGVTSPEMDWSGAKHNVVVVLVDDEMALDEDWRRTLGKLIERAERSRATPGVEQIHFLPVMVDKSLERLSILSQPIRIYSQTDPIEPPRPSTAIPADAAVQGAWEVECKRIQAARGRLRERRLRRSLTESMIRIMRGIDPKALPPRLKVFISHAKTDGAAIAARIRDGFAAISQLEPWFDQNDLPPGFDPFEPMVDGARSTSGGMIAVVTDRYPTRPWCRYEAMQARTPRELIEGGMPWTVQPTVAVLVAGSTWTRTVAPLAQVHRIGWPSASLARPSPDAHRSDVAAAARDWIALDEALQLRLREDECIADVVDRLLLEILFSDVFNRYVQRMNPDGRIILGFIPDGWTLANIKLKGAASRPREILYPGHRLRTPEQKELDTLVSGIFGEGVRVRSLEDHALDALATAGAGDTGGIPNAGAAGTVRVRVALSAGGTDSELWPAGIGSCHIDDLMVRLTRQLLSRNYYIAYGGTLAELDQPKNLTMSLLDAAEGWRSTSDFDLEPDRQPDPVNLINAPPVRNYAAWPNDQKITSSHRAQFLGLCEFISVEPQAVMDPDRKKADALTEMRTKMASDCGVRILFGGKIHGWSGWLPGLAEELLTSHEAGKPVLLLSGFGGCAALLAEYLKGAGGLPLALSFSDELKHREPGEWLKPGTSRQDRQTKYQSMTTHLERIYAEYHDGTSRIHIIDEANETAAIAVILATLSRLFPRAAPGGE